MSAPLPFSPDERRKQGLAAMGAYQAARDEAVMAIIVALRPVIPPGLDMDLTLAIRQGVLLQRNVTLAQRPHDTERKA